jgi:hypothetical protein
MTVNFALRFGGTHDPEGDRREAEASVQGDFKGRHFEASLILQAISWYLRYLLSYRDIQGRRMKVDRR